MIKRKSIFTIIAVVLLTFYISRYYYQVCLIHGSSMEPAYHSWQLTLIDRRSAIPQLGTVIAVRCQELNATIVKRVVAVPGDTLFIRNGFLYVNGAKSPAVSPAAYYEYAGIAADVITLKEGEYFVLGDNCSESIDSRNESVGIISAQDILGEIIPQRSSW